VAPVPHEGQDHGEEEEADRGVFGEQLLIIY
jgi:hypothetical protein